MAVQKDGIEVAGRMLHPSCRFDEDEMDDEKDVEIGAGSDRPVRLGLHRGAAGRRHAAWEARGGGGRSRRGRHAPHQGGPPCPRRHHRGPAAPPPARPVRTGRRRAASGPLPRLSARLHRPDAPRELGPDGRCDGVCVPHDELHAPRVPQSARAHGQDL